MNIAQILARNLEEYIKYNHTSAYYTYQMEYTVINDIKQNRDNILNFPMKKLMEYLEKLVIDNFSTNLTKYEKMLSYDVCNQNNINENTLGDFRLAIVKNIFDEYGDNFLFRVYYTWKTVITDFYNSFINNLLRDSGSEYRVSAYSWTIGSTDEVSVICSKLGIMHGFEEYNKLKILKEDHKFRVDNINK